MGVQVCGAVLNGIIHPHVPLEPLMQAAGLRDVDRNPGPVLGLSGVDVIPGQWLEGSIQGKNLVGILLSGLSWPVDQSRSGGLRLPVMTK